jgi:hypothetical protein
VVAAGVDAGTLIPPVAARAAAGQSPTR